MISAQGLEEAWKLMQTHARSLDIAIISREGADGQDEAGFDLITRSKKITQLEDLPWVCVTNKWNSKQCAKHQNTPMGANAYWVGALNEKTVISTVEAIMGTKLSIQSGDAASAGFVLEESPFAQDGPTTAETTSGSFSIKLELPNIDFDAEASMVPPVPSQATGDSVHASAPEEEHVFKPSEPVELSQIIEPLEISPRGHDLIPTAEPTPVAPPSLDAAKVISPPPVPSTSAADSKGPPQFSAAATPPSTPTSAPSAPEQLEVSGLNAFDSHAGVTAPSLTLTSADILPEIESPPASNTDLSIAIEAPTEAVTSLEAPTEGSVQTDSTNEFAIEPLGEPLQLGTEIETQLAEIASPDDELNWSPEIPPAPEVQNEQLDVKAAQNSEHDEAAAKLEQPHTFDVTSLQPVEQTLNLEQARANEALEEAQVAAAKAATAEAEIPKIESAVNDEEQIALEVDDSEDVVANEMSYLFAKSPKGSQTPAAQIASISAETAFAQPVGDAVVPGGAFQAPDLETLKKYLLLREQDVGVLSSQLRAAKQQIQNLEQQLKMEHAKNTELTHLAETQDKKIKEFDARKEEELSALRSEISDLKLQIRTRTDKMRHIETQMLESAEEVERIRERVKGDLRKIRTREKELENRLEIMKKDSEALIVARENKIVELKRKLDLLEFNMDIMQDQYAKEKEKCVVLKERLAKAAQIVRAAGGLLDHSEMRAQAASIPVADDSKLKAS